MEKELTQLRDDIHAIRRRSESVASRAWDGLMKAAVAGILALFSWQFALEQRVDAHEATLQVVESNRFTITDAANMERRLKDDLPPEWLREIVADLKKQNTDILQRLARLEQQVKDQN